MRYGGSLAFWDTPLSDAGYKEFFVTEGSWRNDTFVIPIDCGPGATDGWDRWHCSITDSVWVRIAADEFYDVALGDPLLPKGPFRAPLYRIVRSETRAIYERWFRDTKMLKHDGELQEYLIASMENEIHILAFREPSFTKLSQPAN